MSGLIATGVSQYLTEQQQQDIVDRIQEAVATGIKAGLMSAADKTKLDGLTPVPSGLDEVGAITIGYIPLASGATDIAAGSTVSGSTIRVGSTGGNEIGVALNATYDNTQQLRSTVTSANTQLAGLTGSWRTITKVNVLNSSGFVSYHLTLLQKYSN